MGEEALQRWLVHHRGAGPELRLLNPAVGSQAFTVVE